MSEYAAVTRRLAARVQDAIEADRRNSAAFDVVGPQPTRLERTDAAHQAFDRAIDAIVSSEKPAFPEPHPHDPDTCEDCAVATGYYRSKGIWPGPNQASTLREMEQMYGLAPGTWADDLPGLASVERAAEEAEGDTFTISVGSGNPKDLIGDTKPPLHLVPAALGIYASQAMANGAAKYGPFNWREHPVKAHVYVAAARRHLDEWFDGDDVASDSGVHHLAHAAAGLAILLDAMATGNLIDDRPTPGPAGRLIAEFTKRAA